MGRPGIGGFSGRQPRPSLPGEEGPREPRPGDHQLRVPEWLRGYARYVWRRATRELDAMGIAAAADRDMLAAYCIAVVMMRRSYEILDVSRVIVSTQTRDGRTMFRGNPAGVEFERYARIAKSLAHEFGFTPAARTRIETPDPDAPDVSDPQFDAELEALLADARKRGVDL